MTNFAGPSEPLMSDGNRKILYTDELDTGETELRSTELGIWECRQCGSKTKTGVVDGDLQEPYQCTGCERQGPFVHAGNGVSIDDVHTAIEANKMWYPPSGVSDESQGELWDDVFQFLWDHWDANDTDIYIGLTAYALSTWFRENLTFVPHLMLMGKTTGGKTRLLNTLARVSYRAVVTASATPASMFRLIDDSNVTYYISEYHGLEYDSRRELDNIVRAGQKRGEVVTRAEQASQGYLPKVYDPFSHVGIATQYTPDDDIINRCIQIRSSPANRDMPATFDEDRGREIRNRLLFARYRYLESDEWEQAEEQAYAYLAEEGIEGRTREKLLSLVTVAHLWDRVEELGPFVDRVVNQDREAAADSEDALFVEALCECAFDEVGSITTLDDSDPFASVSIPLSAIADRYEQITGDEKSNQWAGQLRSRLGLEKERKRDGTVISDPELRPKLRELCDEHNLEWEPMESNGHVKELSESKKEPGRCELCGQDRTLTHREEDALICADCAEEGMNA
jgi:ribosomal protein L37AE/L43A